MARFSLRRASFALLALGALCAPARADEFQYLPHGTLVLYSVDLAAIFKSKLYQDVKPQAAFLDNEINKGLREQIGIDPANVARFTAGAAAFGSKDEHEYAMIVLTTIKPVTAAEIKAAKKPRQFQKDFKLIESKIGKYTVYEERYSFKFDKDAEPAHKGQVFCVVEEKIVLYGDMASMKRILEGDQKPTFSPGVSSAIKQTGLKSTVTVAVDFEKLPERERKSMEKDLGRELPGFADAFPSMKFFTLQLDATDKLKALATMACKDADGAAATLKVGEAGLAKIKLQLKGDPNNPLPAEIQEMLKDFGKLLDSVKLSSKGAEVRAEATVGANSVASFFKMVGGEAKSTKKEESKDEKK